MPSPKNLVPFKSPRGSIGPIGNKPLRFNIPIPSMLSYPYMEPVSGKNKNPNLVYYFTPDQYSSKMAHRQEKLPIIGLSNRSVQFGSIGSDSFFSEIGLFFRLLYWFSK